MKKGFTLIELLVVIAIIGILSAVVVTSVSSSRAKALNAQKIANLQQAELAMQLHREDTGTFVTIGSISSINSLPSFKGSLSATDYMVHSNLTSRDSFCFFAALSTDDISPGTPDYFVVSENGRRTISGPPASITNCQ